jgi:crossover junction endodeoxyribonuclease RuvC
MIILGIDPGIAITGYGLIDEDETGEISCIACGVIRTEAGLSQQERLLHLFNGLNQLIDLYKPSSAAVEKLFFQKNVKSAMTVSQARGVALLSCALAGIPVNEYTPVAVKQAVAGYGKADKQQIQEMVKILLQMDTIVKPDDAADALAIAICHLNSHRFPGMNES